MVKRKESKGEGPNARGRAKCWGSGGNLAREISSS